MHELSVLVCGLFVATLPSSWGSWGSKLALQPWLRPYDAAGYRRDVAGAPSLARSAVRRPVFTGWPRLRSPGCRRAGVGGSRKADDGEIIATSESYTTKDAAKNGIEPVETNAPGAEVVDES